MSDQVPGPDDSGPRVPTRHQAQALARDLLGAQGTRLAHVLTAGSVAAQVSILFDAEEAALLVAAATLHDIGYSPRIAHTGFHPADGGLFLWSHGYSPRLAALVAHHSWAVMTADESTRRTLSRAFPREEGLLADALAYSDMHSAPDGERIAADVRLTDIAARHSDRDEEARAIQLRAALARVRVALGSHSGLQVG